MGRTFLPEFGAKDLTSYQLLSALESSSSRRVGLYCNSAGVGVKYLKVMRLHLKICSPVN
jgi:hypothetical protein